MQIHLKRKLYLFVRKLVLNYLNYLNSFNVFDRLRLLLIHRVYSNYHPLDIFTKTKEASKRNVIDRYESISENLVGKNCLDIGCQSGYFSLRMASDGYWVTGLDSDEIILDKANLMKKKHAIQNVSFANFKVNLESVSSLQVFDNIIYLSIHHHMIKVYGFETASEILKVLCQKTKYHMFFDFPYLDAYKGNELFSDIPDMGDNPDEWIKNYLVTLGFKKVVSLNIFSHNLRPEEKRNLFMAIK